MDLSFLEPNWKKIALAAAIIGIMFFVGTQLLVCYDCAPAYGIPFFVYTPGGFTGWENVPEKWNVPALVVQVLVWYVLACLILDYKKLGNRK